MLETSQQSPHVEKGNLTMRSLLLLTLLCTACDAPTALDETTAPSMLVVPCEALTGEGNVNPYPGRPLIHPAPVVQLTVPRAAIQQ